MSLALKAKVTWDTDGNNNKYKKKLFFFYVCFRNFAPFCIILLYFHIDSVQQSVVSAVLYIYIYVIYGVVRNIYIIYIRMYTENILYYI